MLGDVSEGVRMTRGACNKKGEVERVQGGKKGELEARLKGNRAASALLRPVAAAPRSSPMRPGWMWGAGGPGGGDPEEISFTLLPPPTAVLLTVLKPSSSGTEGNS